MDPERTHSALRLAHVAIDKWELVQVELQGKYSLERTRAFHAYAIQTRWFHILFWCIVTPIPTLVVNILLDVPPLAQPSAGRKANYVFWVRLAIFSVIHVYWMWMQTGYLTPALGMKPWYALSGAIVSTTTCSVYTYVLAGFIPMPIPFVLLTAAPVFSLSMATMFGLFFGRRLKNDAVLRASFNRAGGITGLQLCLMLIFPAFIYGFNSIPTNYQTPYMVFLPLIKLAAKNIMSRLVGNNDDLKPVELIFNVDCFNSIYVSLAMQRATTFSTSLTVMLIDAVQGCVSVYDVYKRFQPLRNFMNTLPAGHPLHGMNFLEIAVALGRESEKMAYEASASDNTASGPEFVAKSVKQPKGGLSVLKSSTKVFVALRDTSNEVNTRGTCMRQFCCSSDSRDAFLHATRKLLFTTEFVILVEYTEVIMPIFYSLVIAASYHLPNRAFYSTISDIEEHELWSMVTSVLVYAGLELISLVVMEIVLRQITGVSPIRQVGFVLDTQRTIVQSKLLSWVLYAVQNSLEHLGADFSFQFKWIHSP